MTIALSCPSCAKPLKLKDSLAGKKIRCPACSEVVSVPATDADDDNIGDLPTPSMRTTARRPAPVEEADDDDPPVKKPKTSKRARSKGGKGPLLVGGLVGLLLIAGVIGTVVYFVVKPGGLLGNSRVTEENLAKIKSGMSSAEVEAILGTGSSTTQDDAEKFLSQLDPKLAGDLRRNAPLAKVKSWTRWDNGPASIFVGFGPTKDGDRVAFSFYATKLGGAGGGTGFMYVTGAVAFGGAEQAVEKTQKEQKILDDPRWVKGPTVRTLLIGQWKQPLGGYDFQANGTVTILDGFNQKGTYRFLDDQRIEIEMPNLFKPDEKIRNVYRVLVDQSSLYLVQMIQETMLFLGPYQRGGAKPR